MLESDGGLHGGASVVEYVRCDTEAWDPSAGTSGAFVSGAFTLEMHRDWAPIGFDRFMELVRRGFFTDNLIYRTIPGFLVQFGVSADPAVQAEYNDKPLQDDPKVRGLQFGEPFLASTNPRVVVLRRLGTETVVLPWLSQVRDFLALRERVATVGRLTCFLLTRRAAAVLVTRTTSGLSVR